MSRPIDSFGTESVEESAVEAATVAVENEVLPEPAVAVEEPVVVVEEPVAVIEEPAVVEEKSEPVVASVSNNNGRVVYSIREKNIPGFGLVKKGYSKVDANKANDLVKQYSFIRFASESEIKDYAPHLA